MKFLILTVLMSLSFTANAAEPLRLICYSPVSFEYFQVFIEDDQIMLPLDKQVHSLGRMQMAMPTAVPRFAYVDMESGYTLKDGEFIYSKPEDEVLGIFQDLVNDAEFRCQTNHIINY